LKNDSWYSKTPLSCSYALFSGHVAMCCSWLWRKRHPTYQRIDRASWTSRLRRCRASCTVTIQDPQTAASVSLSRAFAVFRSRTNSACVSVMTSCHFSSGVRQLGRRVRDCARYALAETRILASISGSSVRGSVTDFAPLRSAPPHRPVCVYPLLQMDIEEKNVLVLCGG
jgi:hypothetical protein